MAGQTKTIITNEQNIADILIDHPQVLLMLELFEIYIPVRQKTIRELCEDHKISSGLFIALLRLYLGLSHTRRNYSFDETRTLIRFLKNAHRHYTEELYPEVKSNIKILYSGRKESALIEKFFNEYFIEVTEHLNYEDKVAFPYMISLYEHIAAKKAFTEPVNYEVSEYKDHHTNIEEKLADLKNLLIRHLPRDNDQKQRRRLYVCISQLETDLKIHAEIEDKMLIPLIEQMEKNLKETG